MSSRYVTLWTYQSEQAYERLRLTGSLTADGRRAPHDFRPFYHWIRSIHARHVPDSSGRPLLWAFASWRMVRHLWALERGSGAREWLLTLRLPADRVLFSDYDNWHWVLNNGLYQPESDHRPECWVSDPTPCASCRLSDAFYEAAQAADPRWSEDYRRLPSPLRRQLEESWETAAFTFSSRPTVQATFEHLDASEVVRALRVDRSSPPPPRDGRSLSAGRAVALNHVPSFLEAR